MVNVKINIIIDARRAVIVTKFTFIILGREPGDKRVTCYQWTRMVAAAPHRVIFFVRTLYIKH